MLVCGWGLRFHDEEVIRASEFSKSTLNMSQTRHSAQTVTHIQGNFFALEFPHVGVSTEVDLVVLFRSVKAVMIH